MPEFEERFCEELDKKYESWYRHQLYTKSKTAETEEEREKARITYLNEIGMHEDWRW